MTREEIRREAFMEAAAIAEKWRDENKAAAAAARKRGRARSDFDGNQTGYIMAEQLDGAAIECNAIAGAIRELAGAAHGARANPSLVAIEHVSAGGVRL